MTDNVFNGTEQAVINAVKSNLLLLIDQKQIFWNGVMKDCVIAGGYFANAMVDEPYKDIDVFVLNMNTQVYNHLTDSNISRDYWIIRDAVDAPTYLNNPHIHGTATNKTTMVQYILTDYTSRKELLESFDYRHATVSYVPDDKVLYITHGAYEDIRNKILTPNKGNTPRDWRRDKFIKRGWKQRSEVEVANKVGGFNLNQFQQVLSQSMGQGVVAQPVSEVLVDHHKGLRDSYDQLVQKTLADMISNTILRSPAQATAFLEEKDIDIDSFHEMIK